MQKVLSLVLAGGSGTRLMPLTKERSKPAVYFGGRYRLIDFVLSNLVNSGLTRIKVFTQYRSSSLLRHLARAWPVASTVLPQYIEAVPASMNLGPTWFRGTADAIWQNLDLLRDERPDHVVIFGADHIYKMDVGPMLELHRDSDADLTVATLPIPRHEAQRFGCVDIDDNGIVRQFLEKPEQPPGMPGNAEQTLASMGNYIFKTEALLAELERIEKRAGENEGKVARDFGKDILATAHERMKVVAYDFNSNICPGESERSRGYWRDVGTLEAYFDANMDLVSIEPYLNLYNQDWPIRGLQPLIGPAKFVFDDPRSGRIGTATDSIVGAGSIISGGRLEQSVVFEGVRVNSFSHVRRSILFPGVNIGRGAHVQNCIIEKNVEIPPGDVIGQDPAADRARGFKVSDNGIVVVSRTDIGQMDEFDVAEKTNV